MKALPNRTLPETVRMAEFVMKILDKYDALAWVSESAQFDLQLAESNRAWESKTPSRSFHPYID